MNIRKGKKEDINAITDLAHAFDEYLIALDDSLIDAPPDKKVIRKVMENGFSHERHAIFVLETVGGEIAGFADCWFYPEFLHGGVIGYMNNIFIKESYRGKGFGSKMLQRVVDEARRRNAVALHVPVKEKNEKAIDFYVKNGIDDKLVMLETRLDRGAKK